MSEKNLSKKFDEIESKTRSLSGLHLKTIAFIAFSWSLFQLWYASPFPFMVGFGVFIDVPARAIHLSFAFLIAFLSYPLLKKDKNKNFGILDIFIALMAFACAMYIVIFYEKIVYSNGILWKLPITLFGANYDFPIEMIIGIIAVILLLEATRRTIGLPLVIVAYVFLAPAIVAGVVTLGVMQQIIRAFGRVETSLQYLVRSWPIIVELISVWKRLNEFENKLKLNTENISKEKI